MPLLEYGRPFFDVHLSLDPTTLSTRLPPDAAMSRIRSAIEAMAGAGEVSVRWLEGCTANGMRAKVQEAEGGQLPLDPAALARLGLLVEAVARNALFATPLRHVGTITDWRD